MPNLMMNFPDDMGILDGRAYTAVLYVSPNGSNSDGKSWQTAYTGLPGALSTASSNANDLTLIYLAPGSYDINTTGDPTFTSNVAIKGSHRQQVEITNEHASSTAVMKFTGIVILENLTINCWNNTNSRNNTGVIISGSNGNRLRKVYFESEDCTGAHNSLQLDGATKYNYFDDIWFDGPAGHSTFIKINSCSKSIFKDLILNAGAVGIDCASTDAEACTFQHTNVYQTTTGIQLASGADNHHFDFVHFAGNTTNISQNAGALNVEWHDLHYEDETFKVIPNNAAGTVLSTGDGAWVLTAAYTDIIAHSQITKPFYVTGFFVNTMTAGDMYYVELTWDTVAGGADTVFCQTMVKGSDNRTAIAVQGIDSGLIPANSAISAKISSDSAGVDNMTCWIQYREV